MSVSITPIESRRYLDVYLVYGARVTHSRPPALNEEIIYCESCSSLTCEHTTRVVMAIALARATPPRESGK